MTLRRSNIRLLSRGWLLFLLLLAASAPGCKKKEPPPSSKIVPLPKKPGQINSAAPAIAVQPRISTARTPVAASLLQKQMSTATRLQPPGGVSLDFTSRRDPFKPFLPAPVAPLPGAGKVGRSRIKDPLPIQTFDTDKFRVSGIITGMKENSALVIDPAGKGYVVKEGMPIGINDGRVKRVTTSAVEVEETFRDDSGKVRKRLVKLTLIRKK